MNKKSHVLGSMFLPFLLIGLLITGWFFWYIPNQKEKAISLGEVCGDMTKWDTLVGYGCCEDCKELDLEYFKHEFSSSLFGANIENCYCKENNSVVQIW